MLASVVGKKREDVQGLLCELRGTMESNPKALVTWVWALASADPARPSPLPYRSFWRPTDLETTGTKILV